MSRCIIFTMMFLGCASFGWAETPEGNSCVACHEETWDEVKDSIHARHQILCQNCHGGDPAKADHDGAKAPETGYIGVPDKKKIAAICGECHANVEAMNFYNIRTDQLARYKTSHHGKKLLLEDDKRVAVCSDCHGYHDVLPISDPNSPVYPKNIPSTCNQCHGKEKIMAAYGLKTDIFENYKKSVHGQALFEKQDISAAQCASCHGSHGAVPPGVKDVGAACGQCHINEKKYFLESVHASLSEKDKFSECVSCHGNHGVARPTPGLYQEACGKCHAPGSAAFERGAALAGMLLQSQEELQRAEGLVKAAAAEGLFVEDEKALLEEAKTSAITMGPLQHSLSEPKISELHQRIFSVTKDVDDKIYKKKQDLRWRKIGLIPLWIFILIMMAAFWSRYKELKKQDHEDKEKP